MKVGEMPYLSEEVSKMLDDSLIEQEEVIRRDVKRRLQAFYSSELSIFREIPPGEGINMLPPKKVQKIKNQIKSSFSSAVLAFLAGSEYSEVFSVIRHWEQKKSQILRLKPSSIREVKDGYVIGFELDNNKQFQIKSPTVEHPRRLSLVYERSSAPYLDLRIPVSSGTHIPTEDSRFNKLVKNFGAQTPQEWFSLIDKVERFPPQNILHIILGYQGIKPGGTIFIEQGSAEPLETVFRGLGFQTITEDLSSSTPWTVSRIHFSKYSEQLDLLREYFNNNENPPDRVYGKFYGFPVSDIENFSKEKNKSGSPWAWREELAISLYIQGEINREDLKFYLVPPYRAAPTNKSARRKIVRGKRYVNELQKFDEELSMRLGQKYLNLVIQSYKDFMLNGK